MKNKILQRLLLLLLLSFIVGVNTTSAMYRTVPFEAINQVTQGSGTFTSTGNSSLAIADLSSIPGIGTVGVVIIQFDCVIPAAGRWQIGIGDKNVRGTNAKGSSSSGYNVEGLMLHINDNSNQSDNYFRVKINNQMQYGTNGSSAYNDAFNQSLHVTISFNRINSYFSYSIVNNSNSTTYFIGSNIYTPIENISIIEAYTWSSNQTIALSNVTVQFDDFYFSDAGGTKYIEDISYTNELVNGGYSNVSYSQSNGSYWRVDGSTVYFIKTTGNEPANPTEGDPIYVTAYASGVESCRFKVRIKTRNLLNPSSKYDAPTNTFDIGSTLGMFTSNVVYMDGMQLQLGYGGHVPVVRSINGDHGVTIIDPYGNTFGNYDQGHEWGTVYKIVTTQARNLTVTGYFSDTWTGALQLYDSWHNAISGKTIANPGDGTLATGVLALEAGQTYYLHQSSGYGHFALKSLSYGDAYFANSYAVTTVGSTYTQAVTNLYNPVYSIVEKQGDIASTGVTINSSTGEVSGITAGGALKIRATGGGKTALYYLTIAYPATDYPGHQWNFCTDVDGDGNEVQRVLDTSDNLKTAPGEGATAYDSNGDEWRGVKDNRIRWVRTKEVNGDNAFIVKETNGLVFNTGASGFFVRNDASEYTHIGIRYNGTSFTIPALAAGDIVELMLRHEHSNSGTAFTATNVTDLRGKDVNESFLITESAQRGDSKTRFVGYYSFIVKEDGNVTFALADVGNCDIQSIRIYKGPYRSTMRNINLSGNTPAPTTMLLDNAEQGYTFNYCNQLFSTATGPAIYVLKGYRPKVNDSQTLGVDYDHEGCVTGSNAAYNPVFFTDEDAYPVSDVEKARLYELRKNLVGLQMYNETWQSQNNSYNNGVIKATSGWGKVTIRMNNYTNDMKYLIGYTNDFTLTIGSAPHQEYPYTWDFTKIAGGSVTGKSDNVLYSIEAEGSNANFNGVEPTNWIKKGNGLYTLNTDNSDDLGSQYVPGAVLVTQDRALSHFNGVDYESKCAKDELDGLGFDGAITMHVDHLPSNVASGWNRSAVADMREPMLSFRITDYAVFTQTGGTVDAPIGTWNNPATVKEAGSGFVQIHENVSIDESSIAHGGIGCRLDDGDTKYIHVTPSSPLQAGDIISVTAYNAYNNREAGISFNKSDSKSNVAQSKMLSGHLVEETIDYTVATNDGLDGLSDFYLYRNENTVHITSIEITRSASAVPNLDWSIYTLTNTTITVPDLNAGKQDWIYVSATEEPTEVKNAVEVDNESIGSVDANTDVYKYKVTDAGNVYLTFPAGTKIYKIGVTHIMKEIHPVGNIGWATESRDHSIDHGLTGYFTTNDANAYTVCYDSYDLQTATVALTPIPETGYVPAQTGIVLRQDNNVARTLYQVPLFYPSYTREAASIPADNMMVPVVTGGRQYLEVNEQGLQKFILTNVHWTYTRGSGWGDKITETDAAGFYRLHVWGDDVKDMLPDNCAYLGVPEGELPLAVWDPKAQAAPLRRNTIGIREENDDLTSMTLIETSNQDDLEGAWYDLNGRLLPTPPHQPGIYIHQGKKIVVRY